MAGESIMFSGPADKIPAGYLIEDGAEVGRVAYATLFTAIGTTYGAGDGVNTFNLPDSRGEAWRGLDMGRGVDSGRALGSHQPDSMQGHKHRSGAFSNMPGGSNFNDLLGGDGFALEKLGGFGSVSDGKYAIYTTTSDVPDGSNGVPRVGRETRMRNIAKIPLIKY